VSEWAVSLGPCRSRVGRERVAVRRPEHVLSLDLVEGPQLDQAAAFVVGLLEHPGSDIRVIEGQLEPDEAIVVPDHPNDFQLVPVTTARPGTVWAIEVGRAS